MMYWALSQAILHTFSYLILRETLWDRCNEPHFKIKMTMTFWRTQGSIHSGSAPGTGPSSGLSPARFDHKPPSHHCTTGSLLPGLPFHAHIHHLCVLLEALISLIYRIIPVQHSRSEKSSRGERLCLFCFHFSVFVSFPAVVSPIK